MKTIYIYPLLFILICSIDSIGQNNLIRNPSAEDPSNDATPYFPGLVDNRTPKSYYSSGGWNTTNYGGQDGLEVWEDRLKTKTTILTAPAQLPEKLDLLLHSPEWFMVTPIGGDDRFRAFENGNLINPHSGDGYIGMGPGELVQQKFKSNNKFEEGESYTLNFYIRPLENGGSESDLWSGVSHGGDWSDGLDLKVYLRKKKMK